MAVVHVLDGYYLAITLLVTVAYQLFFFSIAFTLKFDKLTDFAGGTNFVLLSILTLSLSGHAHARQILTSLLLILWATRLSTFLLFRILKTGTDTRFDDKRDKFLPFLGFWVAQMAWVWIVSLPVTILNSPNVTSYPQPRFGTGRDIVGLILWTVGFLMEAVSDAQKYRFKTRVQTQDKNAVCGVGLFAWTRHPNYFGEIILQFAIFMIAVSPSAYGYIPQGSGAYAAQYAAILGPVFLTVLLMFVSGLTLQERPGAKKKYEASGGPEGEGWKRYAEWLRQTSILIPFPPQLYARMPVVVKRTLFLEFPIYIFDPAKHADQSKVKGQRDGDGEREREAEEGRGSGSPGAEGESSQQQQQQQQPPPPPQRTETETESGEALVK